MKNSEMRWWFAMAGLFILFSYSLILHKKPEDAMFLTGLMILMPFKK